MGGTPVFLALASSSTLGQGESFHKECSAKYNLKSPIAVKLFSNERYNSEDSTRRGPVQSTFEAHSGETNINATGSERTIAQTNSKTSGWIATKASRILHRVEDAVASCTVCMSKRKPKRRVDTITIIDKAPHLEEYMKAEARCSLQSTDDQSTSSLAEYVLGNPFANSDCDATESEFSDEYSSYGSEDMYDQTTSITPLKSPASKTPRLENKIVPSLPPLQTPLNSPKSHSERNAEPRATPAWRVVPGGNGGNFAEGEDLINLILLRAQQACEGAKNAGYGSLTDLPTNRNIGGAVCFEDTDINVIDTEKNLKSGKGCHRTQGSPGSNVATGGSKRSPLQYRQERVTSPQKFHQELKTLLTSSSLTLL